MRRSDTGNLLGISFSAHENWINKSTFSTQWNNGGPKWDDIVFAIITGTPGHDQLIGTAADDIIYGLAGTDTIRGRGGKDELYGGEDNDFLEGGNDDDLLVGGPGNDYAYGFDGNDIFRIDPGDDTTFDGNVGMDGIDTILNNSGGDIDFRILDFFNPLENGGSIEFIDLGGFQILGTTRDEAYRLGDMQLLNRSGGKDISTLFGDDTVEGAALQALIYDLGAGDDIFTGVNAISDTVYGGSGRDILQGLAGDDMLFGGSGNDVLRGQQGDDLLSGGFGGDTLNGGAGEDTVSYANANTRVIVNLFNGVTKQGHAIGDQLISIENLIGSDFDDHLQGDNGETELYGGGGNDQLYGRGGRDYLFGGEGDDALAGGGIGDYLNGGVGNDSLSGGTGKDVFIFDNDFGADIITDFEDTKDRIDMSGNSFANSFGDISSAATQIGVDVQIELNTDNILVLENINLTDLDASDFIF